jgi:hypothetical protein
MKIKDQPTRLEVPAVNSQAGDTPDTISEHSVYLDRLKGSFDEKTSGGMMSVSLKVFTVRDQYLYEERIKLGKIGLPTLEELDHCCPKHSSENVSRVNDVNKRWASIMKELARREAEEHQKNASENKAESEAPVEAGRQKHPLEQLHFSAITPEATEILMCKRRSGSDWAVYTFLANHLTLETGITNRYSRNAVVKEINDFLESSTTDDTESDTEVKKWHRTTILRSLDNLVNEGLIKPLIPTKISENKHDNTLFTTWEVTYVAKRYALYKEDQKMRAIARNARRGT